MAKCDTNRLGLDEIESNPWRCALTALKRFTKYATVLIIVLIACLPLVWKRDWFQRSVFPQRYWTKRVDHLSALIKDAEMEIKIANMNNEIISKTFDMQVEKELISMESVYDNRNEALQEATKSVKDLTDKNLEYITLVRQELLWYTNELSVARVELQKIKQK